MINPAKFNKMLKIAAVVLWAVGFVLSFSISPCSRYIFVPDLLLLVGFCPLLIAYRTKWLWIFFGLSNAFIGFVLLVTKFLPNSDFTFDPKMLLLKNHLVQYHEPFVWMIVGVVSTVVGLGLVGASLVTRLAKRLPRGL